MNKKSKGIILFLVILIILVLVFLGYTYAFNPNKNKSTNQINVINNIVNNVNQSNAEENKVIENEVKNEIITENKIEENKIVENKIVETPSVSTDIEGDNSETQADNDEEKAIAIVKKDWGDTSGVAFRVEQINANGTYVISVRNEDSVALEWYTVNPTTGKFTK